jgi:hypothetical protein
MKRHLALAEPTRTVSRRRRPATIGMLAPPPSSRRALIGSLVGASLLACSCASFNTQEYAFARERWQLCESKVSGARLKQIERDGLTRFYYVDLAASQAMQQCLDETANRQSLRVLAPKPPRAIGHPLAAPD